MRITRLSTEQFAGLQDRSLDFTPGLNVILGRNETGKSSLMTALYHVLMTSVKLDKRSGRSFITQCFPSNGSQVIDATVELESGGETYTIEKIWDLSGADTSVKLKAGAVLRGAQAETQLAALTEHTPAVYSNLIFGLQRNEAAILDWCYAFFSTSGNPDVEAVKKRISEAISAVGGISPDRLTALLNQKRKALAGHWDFDRDQPERGRGIENPWVTGKGSILDRYYTYKIAEQEQQRAASVEEEQARLTQLLADWTTRKEALSQEHEQLLRQKGTIALRSRTEQLKANADSELAKLERVIQSWPARMQALETGRQLAAKVQESDHRKQKAALESQRQRMEHLTAEIAGLQSRCDAMQQLPDDLNTANTLFGRIRDARLQLSAVKLRAEVQLTAPHTAELHRTNGSVEHISESVNLTADGIVDLRIPGIATLRVTPQGLDVDALQRTISSDSRALAALLARYQAADLPALTALHAAYQKDCNQLRQAQQEYQLISRGCSIEECTAQIAAIELQPTLVLPETLDADVQRYLQYTGKRTLDAAVAACEAGLQSYLSEYGSLSELEARCAALRQTAAQYHSQLLDLTDAPQLSEAAFSQKLAHLKAKLEEADQQLSAIHQKLGSLSALGASDLVAMETETARHKSEWEAEKRKYLCYSQILGDFLEIRAQSSDRFSAFYDRFNENLSLLTGNALSMQSDGGLTIRRHSTSLSSAELLSEGTKKTVLLAFRLAVLSCFYPDGGGLVVLDDELLDMDPDRRAQAAVMLRQFAERNQVLFTTCDPAIAALLSGHTIVLDP